MSDNCKFEYGVTEYQCEFNPRFIDMWWERKQVLSELASGDDKLYKKGFKFHALLTWSDPTLIRKDQMTAFSAMYNATEGITFTPLPASQPSITYNVSWNDATLDFHMVEGVTAVGYVGKMHLTGQVVSEIPTNWTVGEL